MLVSKLLIDMDVKFNSDYLITTEKILINSLLRSFMIKSKEMEVWPSG